MLSKDLRKLIVEKMQVFWIFTQFRWQIFTGVSKERVFFINDLWTLAEEGTMLLQNA